MAHEASEAVYIMLDEYPEDRVIKTSCRFDRYLEEAPFNNNSSEAFVFTLPYPRLSQSYFNVLLVRFFLGQNNTQLKSYSVPLETGL